MSDNDWLNDRSVAITREEAKALGKNNPHQIHRFIRAVRHPWLFMGMTEDLLSLCQPMNADIKARFEEVFDVDQRKNLTIVLHPLYKRWTVLERTWHKGQPLYHPVHMFHTGGRDGYLPPDLQRDDHMCDHVTGEIGDYRDISYRDLEMVEKCDMWKYGWEEVLEWMDSFEVKEQAELDSEYRAFRDDFLDYHFWLAMQESQDHYSKPWSTRSVDVKADPGRWKIEDKGGYKVRTRIWGEEGDVNEMKALTDGKLNDYFDPSSVTGRAAMRILEIKNENYYGKHGVTLWEAATGISPDLSSYGNADSSIERDRVNREQVEGIKSAISTVELPKDAIKLEDFLIQAVRDKVLIPT